MVIKSPSLSKKEEASLYLFLAGVREWAVTEFVLLTDLRSDFR